MSKFQSLYNWYCQSQHTLPTILHEVEYVREEMEPPPVDLEIEAWPGRQAPSLLFFTAAFGPSRPPRTPVGVIPGADYLCFTDRDFKNPVWNTALTGPIHTDPRVSNRIVKFSDIGKLDYDYIIYVDSNVLLTGEPLDALFSALGSRALGLFEHSRGLTWKTDMLECLRLKKIHPAQLETLKQPLSILSSLNSSKQYAEGGVLIRRRGEHAAGILEFWGDLFLRYPVRDQFLFPIVFERHRESITLFGRGLGTVRDNPVGMVLRK